MQENRSSSIKFSEGVGKSNFKQGSGRCFFNTRGFGKNKQIFVKNPRGTEGVKKCIQCVELVGRT